MMNLLIILVFLGYIQETTSEVSVSGYKLLRDKDCHGNDVDFVGKRAVSPQNCGHLCSQSGDKCVAFVFHPDRTMMDNCFHKHACNNEVAVDSVNLYIRKTESSTTISITTTSSEESTRNEPPQSGVSQLTGVIVGVVVGVTTLVCIAVVIIVIIRRRKTDQPSKHQAPETRTLAYNVNNNDDIITSDRGNNAAHSSNPPTVQYAMIDKSSKKLNKNQKPMNRGSDDITSDIIINNSHESQHKIYPTTNEMTENTYYEGQDVTNPRTIEMTENTYYEGQDVKNPTINEMTENTYYEGQDVTNPTINEMTENTYYEGQDATNPTTNELTENSYYEAIQDNKTKGQEDNKEDTYVYTYGHFNLEGRERALCP